MTASLRYAWLLVAVIGAAALSVAAFDNDAEEQGERIQRLSGSYACPTCAGQTVAESNSPAAVTVRDFIRVRVEGGASDAEIRDELVQAYGGEVLLTPPGDGVSILVWVLPVVVAVSGAALVVVSLRRAPPEGRQASDADRELVSRARGGAS